MITKYICYRDNGYEGCSEPLQLYDREELAIAWVKGCTDNHGYGAKYKKMEIELLYSPEATK